MAQGGFWGLGTMGVALPYALLAGGIHQGVLVAVAAFGVGMSLTLGMVASLLPVPASWRRPIMLIYTALHVVIVVVLAIADGGADSPMALGFFGTFTFAAYSMPLRLLPFYGTLNMAGYLTVYVVAGAHRPAYVPVELAGLLATSAACAHQHHHLLHQRRRLFKMARTDPLTDCLNRRGFDEQLSTALAAAVITPTPLAVLLVDLDNFKAVNDLHGHEAGDELLAATARSLRDILGQAAPIGRLGGDEFAAVVTAVRTVSELHTLVGKVQDHIDASVGIGILGPGIDTPRALLSAADHSLYRQKAQRRAFQTSVPTRSIVRPRPADHANPAVEPSLRGQGETLTK
jgi:diguanylate cyclase (GGDEF)-like protein